MREIIKQITNGLIDYFLRTPHYTQDKCIVWRTLLSLGELSIATRTYLNRGSNNTLLSTAQFKAQVMESSVHCALLAPNEDARKFISSVSYDFEKTVRDRAGCHYSFSEMEHIENQMFEILHKKFKKK